MFKRKMLSALYTAVFLTIITGVFVTILILFYVGDGHSFSESTTSLGFLPLVFFYTLIGNFVYGLPVSILIEYITRHGKRKKQVLFSFSLYSFFGLIIIFLLGWLVIYTFASAILFFLVDTRLKNNNNKLLRTSTFAN
ncbi:hypothetical protein [Bacillus taeanensis]|uniref:Major facilitator superfamily (MFS) profile domain-containing protein n=1 Tax=Bacillus taeanensis TaxID=273032 RepID=A0A366XUC3_9BACI|nr:hypothetical protein [Bacillus taeanensis]RBW68369.1 hypothetical protein DS031_17040 [Bacillus taeanensis]